MNTKNGCIFCIIILVDYISLINYLSFNYNNIEVDVFNIAILINLYYLFITVVQSSYLVYPTRCNFQM